MWPFKKKSAKPKTPKARTAKPDYQHVIGGFWGNHMRFFNTEPSADGAFRLWGHKPFDDFPRVGQIIKAEFNVAMDKQFRAHSKLILAQTGRGKLAHCWADGIIDGYAASTSGPCGNPKSWIGISQNRHFEITRHHLP